MEGNGASIRSKKTAVRLVAAAWCLLAFVLVTAYQSVLISYILTPVMQPPIVNSMNDLATKKEVQLVVDKGPGID